MEKISQHIRKKFTPVELYMDDIESIVNLMIEAKFSAIKIRTLTHEYSPDELSKITT